jgi:amino acid transporter
MFAVNELLGMFCPTWTKTVYEVSIAMLLLMSLWAFTVVFSRSAVSKFSLFDGSDCSDINHFTSGCDWSFRVFVAIFGVVCISISLLDFKEMVTYQLILTIARFILIGVFVLVAAVGIWTDPIDNHSTKTQPPYISDVPAVNFSGFIGVFSTGLFAQLVNFGAPDLIAPMAKRADGLKVMIAALVSTALMYALVGEACALYFGSAIESQVNVNFSHYRGGRAPGESVPWWASIIAYYAALFPAFDVLSSTL